MTHPFGLLGDGSDETSKLLEAFNSGVDGLVFPSGVYGFSEELLFETRTDFKGAGRGKTIFKNLSATANGMKWPNVNDNVYQRAEGFTIDMNGSTGIALFQGAQQSHVAEVVIKNQTGTNPAWHVEGATRCSAERSRISQCDTGLKIKDTNYPIFSNIMLEAKRHRALELRGVVRGNFPGMYIETDETEVEREELLYIYGGYALRFPGFASEI